MLILLRKAMRDKGVEWFSFKEALDKSIAKGEFKFNDESQKQYDKMSEPENGPLDKMMYFFGIGGK